MNGRVTCLLLLFLMPSPVWAKKPASPLLAQLETEFAGKEFTTKVTFGNSIQVFYADGTSEKRLIDTEISPDGTIKYLVRRGLSLIGRRSGNFYVEQHKIDSTVAVGSRVRVLKVEMKDDRIELLLSAANQAYAKLKVMLGEGFETSYDLDAVLGVVSRALRVERFERLQAVRSQYDQLKEKLATAEGRYKAAQGDPRSRLQAAQQFQNVLRELVKNRTDYDSLTQTASDPESDQYVRQIAGLDKSIQALDQEARKERAEEIRKILTSEADEAAQIKVQLQRKPGSLSEWEQQNASLARWEELLHHRQTLHTELTGLGQSPPASETDAVRQGFQEVQTLRAGLEAQRQALQLAELDSEYRGMERRSRQLREAYTLAAGSPRQRPEGEKLYIHLHRMHENRTAAQNLGSNQAEGQAASLQKDMDRLQRQIGPVQVPPSERPSSSLRVCPASRASVCCGGGVPSAPEDFA